MLKMNHFSLRSVWVRRERNAQSSGYVGFGQSPLSFAATIPRGAQLEYSAMIESHLQKRLTEAVPGFDMEAFSKDLLAREDEALAFRRW